VVAYNKDGEFTEGVVVKRYIALSSIPHERSIDGLADLIYTIRLAEHESAASAQKLWDLTASDPNTNLHVNGRFTMGMPAPYLSRTDSLAEDDLIRAFERF
jgi:hypothetical protein